MLTDVDVTDTLLTIPQVAERLACTRGTVYNLIKDGRLVAVTHGKRTRVRASDLDAYIASLLPVNPVAVRKPVRVIPAPKRREKRSTRP